MNSDLTGQGKKAKRRFERDLPVGHVAGHRRRAGVRSCLAPADIGTELSVLEGDRKPGFRIVAKVHRTGIVGRGSRLPWRTDPW